MSLSLSNNAALFYNLSGSETYGGAVQRHGKSEQDGDWLADSFGGE